MLKRIFISILYLMVGYVIFAFAGFLLINVFSDNQHDLSIEAIMTSAFVCGPVGAVIFLFFSLFGKKN